MTAHERRPDWLDTALRGHPASDLSSARLGVEDLPPVKRGEVRVIGSMDSDAPARMGMILDVDEERSTVGVMLLSNLVEHATDLDVVLPAELTGLPFELVAEADVVGTAWEWQLAPPLSRVPEPTREAIERLPRLNDPDALSLLRGMPLSGRTDVRWEWKENEVIELQRLTADCVSTLLDAPAIDVGFLAAESLDREAIQEMLLTASELASAGVASLPSSTAHALGLEDAVTRDRLVAELGVDAWLAVHELLITSVGGDQPLATSSIEALPHRRVSPDRDPLRLAVAGSQSTMRVITWSELWDDPRDGVIQVEIDGRTRHVVRERVAA